MDAILSLFWTFLWTAGSVFGPLPIALEGPPAFRDSVSIAPPPAPGGFSAGLSGMEVRFGDQDVPYAVMSVFALPGEETSIEIAGPLPGYRLGASAGTLRESGPDRFVWRAPDSAGTSVITVRAPGDSFDRVTLHAFVLVPYSEMKRGAVRGYAVGSYPLARSSRTREERPRGFIEVTAANADLSVSPHFKLAQFVCKSGGGGYPKYLVLQPSLLVRLETLLAHVNDRGIRARTFQVMSAYRTPGYNRAIGNTTSFTRHQYGDAADIFVDDSPADGRMDDLDQNGRFDRRDALLLRGYAEETEASTVEGGLSAYAPTHEHGAFVHVDTRGYEARW